MSEFLLFVVAGVAAGAVYALAGVGLVLTYKTSGVFNFAHGALATVSAYAFFTLAVDRGWSWQWAAAVSVLILGPIMGLLLEPLARALRQASLPAQVAGTVGILLAVQSLIGLIYPDEELRRVPTFFPDDGFTVAGTPVQWADVATLAVALVATIALTIVMRVTRFGMATRALVDDDELLALNAINPRAVRRGAWVIGSTLASASGVLFAPLLPLNSLQLTLLVVSAFGAAAIGGFRSLTLTLAGGLLIGVGASLATRYLTDPIWAGFAPSLPFVVLFIVIVCSRRRVIPVAAVRRATSTWSAPPRLQIGLGVLVVAGLAIVPTFAGVHLTSWTTGVGAIVLFLSLALLVRTAGQVSLAHVTFCAIGAAAFSHLAVGRGLPWPIALLGAGLIAVPVGALLAVPALRLSGLHLALATFGFGILVQYMFYSRDLMFGSNGLGLSMPRPSLIGGDPLGDGGFYYLTLAIAVGCAAIVVGLTKGRLGRLLRGIRDAPTALATTGASVTTTLNLVFCLSAFLAAVAGVLMGVAQTTASSISYPPLLSLTYLAVILIQPGRAPWDAVLAGLSLFVLPSYLSSSDDVTLYLQLIFGLSAVVVSTLPPTGPPAWLRTGVDAVFRPDTRSGVVATNVARS